MILMSSLWSQFKLIIKYLESWFYFIYMKVKDLIEKLQKFDPEAKILYKHDFEYKEVFQGAEVHRLNEDRVLMVIIKPDDF